MLKKIGMLIQSTSGQRQDEAASPAQQSIAQMIGAEALDAEKGQVKGGPRSVSDSYEACDEGMRKSLPRPGVMQEVESIHEFRIPDFDDVSQRSSMTSNEDSKAGPSSRGGESGDDVSVRIDTGDSNRVNQRQGASDRAGSGMSPLDPARDTVVTPQAKDEDSKSGKHYQAGINSNLDLLPADKGRESVIIEIPPKECHHKVQEPETHKISGVIRTTSNFSVDSMTGDVCRICQQHTEEPLMELGCHCRGELAKAHLSCIEHWFGNKGTNKCEVCQHVATNVPAPASQPMPHFWVWRVGGPYGATSTLQRPSGGARFHPLWAALLILIAGLLFDVLISIFLGASALPVNIIIGVLVVLGLGTAARLVLECWHERMIRRNIRRMEEEPSNFEDLEGANTGEPGQDPIPVAVPQAVPAHGEAEGVAVDPPTA